MIKRILPNLFKNQPKIELKIVFLPHNSIVLLLSKYTLTSKIWLDITSSC